MIFVSHNMTAVEGLCDRVLLIEAGELCLDSEPRRVVQTYLNKSSASAAQELSVRALPRQGSGDARFTAFHVENSEGDHVKFVQSGQRIRLVFAYKCKPSILGLALNVGFGVHGEDDQCLFVIYASQLGKELRVSQTRGTFICTLPRLPLNPGKYSVIPRIEVHGVKLTSHSTRSASWKSRKAISSEANSARMILVQDPFWSTASGILKGHKFLAPLALLHPA